ncbi:hypothetical protein T265_09003 [Opisthorchis viverrini]|uniref:Uncharacterized protein n=1 Tax=Opisthorchis viverrini TaxID=6198 RepID=A0A074ZBP0_OPIVI|nr:hypothetical protein T265_09003 [Opisthorchis viverrini]KER23022.1 hypothetical protein T265_09003 [Opisthorchis viverrini]
MKKNRSAVAPFWCLTAMSHEGGTRAGILPGRSSLDGGSRETGVGFEPRTFQSVPTAKRLEILYNTQWECFGHALEIRSLGLVRGGHMLKTQVLVQR